MEKTFYTGNGTVYSLISENPGNFYKRIYQSESGRKITERGFRWLGSIRTYRNQKNSFQKLELSIGFGFYWVGRLWALLVTAFLMLLICLIWVAERIWDGICWLAELVAKFFAWLISIFKKKPQNPKEPEQPKEPRKPMNLRWLNWVLPLIAILLLIMFFPNPEDIKPQITPANKVVQMLPRQTAIGRGYLDGEENLLGCKFIFGEKAKKFLENKANNLTTFESVSDASWVAQVDRLLKPEIKAQLSDEQIAIITLVAMRNGEYGFPASKFLKLVNKGDFDAAADEIWVFDRSGNARNLEEEGKLYTWCLWAMWKGHLSFDELWVAKHHGYKDLNVKELYPSDDRKKRVFKPEFREIILGSKCANKTIKEMNFFEGRSFDKVTAIDPIVISEESWWNKICRFVYPAKMWLRSLFGIS